MLADKDQGALSERLRIALKSAQLVIYDWLIDGDHLSFVGDLDGRFRGVLGPDISSSLLLTKIMHRDDLANFTTLCIAALKTSGGGALHRCDVRLRREDGSWMWVEIHGEVIERDASGRATRFAGALLDVSESKHAEQQILRLRDLYAALSATNQAIVRSTDRDGLFHAICRVAVDVAGFKLAWVGIADPASGVLLPMAVHGTPIEYVRNIRVSVRENDPEGLGPAGIAFRSLEPCVWNAFPDRIEAHPWRHFVSTSGFRAVGGFPILAGGAACGVLLLYSAEDDYFDESRIHLIQEMAGDISFALDNFERDAQRRATELALAESEALKSAVMTTALDCILSIDPGGRIFDCNPAAEVVLGYPCADLIGRDYIDVIAPARFHAERRKSFELFQKEGSSHFLNRRTESIIRRFDDSEIPVEVSVTATRRRGQRVLTVYLRDISDRKRSEQALRDSASRYRELVERSPDPVMVHHDGVMKLVNQAMVQLLGATAASELLGRNMLEFIRPAFHAAVRHRMMLVQGGSAESTPFMEQTWVRIDGTELVVDAAGTRVEYEGRPASQVVVRDMSERKRAELVQAGQNRVLSMVASGAELNDIMIALIAFIETQSGRTRCSTMLLDDDGRHLSHAISPSMPPEFMHVIDPLPVTSTSMVCGTAAWRREPVIVKDIIHDPLTASLADVARQYGIHAAASWPVMGKSGQILGTFAMYFDHVTEPTVDEMRLIGISTDLAGIAIESRRAEERIRYLAHYDDLTGLPNRFLFKQYLEQALTVTKNRGRKLATMFLDLDRFKNINDTFGHAVGDQVLREIAARFKSCLRDTDRIARMGGDEFFILIDDLDSSHQVTEVAQRILTEAARPFFVRNEECQLSASIGISMFPEDGSDSDTLLKNSDIAMYRAKSLGKNTYQFYSASKNIHTVERLGLESRMRRALENGEFLLHYQPRVSISTGLITGVEALVRWNHPERGLVPPLQFIPIAEETGLIVPLGWQILQMALVDAQRFAEALGKPLQTAVNLSVRQLDAPHFVADVTALLAKSGVAPSTIELEITESMLIHNPDHAERVVLELDHLGLKLAIDDFGTGYSSLTYLKRFPVEIVKIDRSFVKDMPGDPNDLAITQAIIAMAHSLGLHVVAEGVETQEQADILKRFGCDEYQGFLFSKPIPVEELLTLLRESRRA